MNRIINWIKLNMVKTVVIAVVVIVNVGGAISYG